MPRRTANRRGSSKRPSEQSSSAGGKGESNGAIELMGISMSFPLGAELYGESEPADYLYKVIRGTVRTYKVLIDGRRQVGSFYVAGDIFGLEIGAEHSLSAEAVTACKVLVIKRSALVSLAGRDHDVARQLRTITDSELRRVQGHMILLIKSAQERVASFLLEMSERASHHRSVELPMSRQDIADYLGLTIETVSRTLTILEDAAIIELSSTKRILLRNRSALTRLNA